MLFVPDGRGGWGGGSSLELKLHVCVQDMSQLLKKLLSAQIHSLGFFLWFFEMCVFSLFFSLFEPQRI